MYQLPRLGKRELICLLLFTCSCVVSVRRGVLFLWVLGMGCVILLWHSHNAYDSDTDHPFLDLHLSISNNFVSSKMYHADFGRVYISHLHFHLEYAGKFITFM